MKPIIRQLFCFLLITCGILAWHEQQGDYDKAIETVQEAREGVESFIIQKAAIADGWLFEQFPNPDVRQQDNRQTATK